VKNFIGLCDMSIKYTDRLKKKLDRDVSSPLDYAEGSSLSLHDFQGSWNDSSSEKCYKNKGLDVPKMTFWTGPLSSK
jgi:hypothetical protein